MAIGVRGTNSGGSNGVNLSLNLPVGIAAGDLVIGAYCMSTSTDADLNMQVSTAGYTEESDQYANDSREANFGVYYKLQGSTPDSNITFVTSGTQDIGGVLIALTGVDQTTPIDTSSIQTTGINSPAPNCTSITPVSNNTWIIALGGSSIGGVTITAPSGYSNLTTGDSVGNDCSAMLATKLLATPAAENPAAFGGWGTDTTQAWCATTMAIRPATAKLTADAGSYSLTGTAATLRKGKVLAAAAGSYGLSGQAATLRHAWKIAAGAGGYSLGGQAAGLVHGWKVAAGVGSYTLNGQDASLTLSAGNKQIDADAGAYDLVGTAASLIHARIIAAGVGGYSLGGQTASLLHARKIVAGAGSYGLTGAAAQLLQARRVSAGVGSYSLDGQTVALKRIWRLVAEVGGYALTGSNVTLSTDAPPVDHGLGRGRVSSSSASGRIRASAATGRPSVSKSSGRVTVY